MHKVHAAVLGCLVQHHALQIAARKHFYSSSIATTHPLQTEFLTF